MCDAGWRCGPLAGEARPTDHWLARVWEGGRNGHLVPPGLPSAGLLAPAQFPQARRCGPGGRVSGVESFVTQNFRGRGGSNGPLRSPWRWALEMVKDPERPFPLYLIQIITGNLADGHAFFFRGGTTGCMSVLVTFDPRIGQKKKISRI